VPLKMGKLNLKPQLLEEVKPGHEALAAASAWLSAEARDGRRKPEAAEMSNAGEAMTARDLKALTVPARRLVASSGALTARELRKAGTQDASLLKPLTKEEREMKKILELLSAKAAQKFNTVRAAMRFLDADRSGAVDRSEVRYFFRAYDFSNEIADKFFEHLDYDLKGELDYTYFVNFLRPYLQGAVNGTPLCSNELSSGGGMDKAMEDKEAAATGRREGFESIDEDFRDVLQLIGNKSHEKFGNLRQAFRFVDGEKTGTISRSEMHYFFRAFNLPVAIADRFHNRLDITGSGDVSFSEFAKCLGPYLTPDKVVSPRRTSMSGVHQMSSATAENDRTSPARSRVSSSADDAVTAGDLPLQPRIDPELRAELRKLMQDIGDKLPLKFKHQRDAFRVLDLERNGRITKGEMRGFFRGFGHPEEVADKVFDLLDEEGLGEIDFSDFMKHFDCILGTAFRQAKRIPLIPVEDPKLSKEVNDIAAIIGQRLTTKYKNIQEAFRALDLNKDGKVSQYEMRVFVKNFGMPIDSADKFFNALDSDGSGCIRYSEFVHLFSDKKEF